MITSKKNLSNEIFESIKSENIWRGLPNDLVSLCLKVAETIKDTKFPGATINSIDGLRVEYDDSWGLIRASNTQPVIVCRFESKIEQEVKEIQELVFNKLKSFKGVLL